MSAIIVLTLTSLVLGIIIVIIESLFNRVSKHKQKIMSYLPGYNCGACGFAGCSGMADAMIKNINAYKKCKPLRGDSLVAMEEFVKEEGNRKKLKKNA